MVSLLAPTFSWVIITGISSTSFTSLSVKVPHWCSWWEGFFLRWESCDILHNVYHRPCLHLPPSISFTSMWCAWCCTDAPVCQGDDALVLLQVSPLWSMKVCSSLWALRSTAHMSVGTWSLVTWHLGLLVPQTVFILFFLCFSYSADVVPSLIYIPFILQSFAITVSAKKWKDHLKPFQIAQSKLVIYFLLWRNFFHIGNSPQT